MGTLFYGERTDITFEDRTLFHLQIVMGAKLRRGESFFFTWKEDVATGSGRGSIWIQHSIPLVFTLRTSRPIAVNRRWLEQLTISANSAQGLFLSEEPLEEADSTPEAVHRHETQSHGHSTRAPLPRTGATSTTRTPPASHAVGSTHTSTPVGAR
ncbi:hypothetical protein B0I08_10676 [Glaciihabitans tibetensis]|uniref:DUF7882 domain-containing protein n=1 Tax=Glaciihabitans tibetensis TaxID=1266600 RepID=A0A2T0VB86_9MICO|nr:hypothetical protein B0I08_10676 [Glaciihabitans tibetensis]